jgi:hypothetical protein
MHREHGGKTPLWAPPKSKAKSKGSRKSTAKEATARIAEEEETNGHKLDGRVEAEEAQELCCWRGHQP